MKRLISCCILIQFVCLSCGETKKDVHFHGQLTLNCDEQGPVKNIEVTIIRYYDEGIHMAEQVGETITDDNGNFSLIADVKEKGVFLCYRAIVYPTSTTQLRSYTGSAQTTDNSGDILLDCDLNPDKAYTFHLQNNAPAGPTDMFDYLIVKYFYGQNRTDTVLTDLKGTTVDTSVTRFLFPDEVTYFYAFTKNGIYTEVPFEAIVSPDCLDTAIVNVIY